MGLQGCGGFFGLVDIAHHHRGAGDADFAFFAIGLFFGGAGFDDFVVGIWEGQANTTFASLVIGG